MKEKHLSDHVNQLQQLGWGLYLQGLLHLQMEVLWRTRFIMRQYQLLEGRMCAAHTQLPPNCRSQEGEVARTQ